MRLPSPQPYYYDPGGAESTAILLAMELRHLLDGVAPRVCGVLGAFGLSAERFGDYLGVPCR